MSIRSPHCWFLAVIVVFAGLGTNVRAADIDELEALQKKMFQRLLKGDTSPKELEAMVAEMNKLLLKELPELQPLFPNGGLVPLGPNDQLKNLAELLPRIVQPLAPPRNGGMGLAQLPQLQLRQLPPFAEQFPRGGRFRPAEIELPPPPADVSDKRLKEFDEQIEKLKDNPEAQAELRKARDEYKKALEEGMRKGVERPRENPPVAPPAFPQPMARVLPQLNNINVPLQFDRPGLVRPKGPVRLGVVFEKPPAILVEHLNLPAEVGVVVVEVVPGSVAEKAGLRVNDVVVKLGGKDAPSELNRFQALVAELKAGEKIEAVLYRKGKKEIVGGIALPATGR